VLITSSYCAACLNTMLLAINQASVIILNHPLACPYVYTRDVKQNLENRISIAETKSDFTFLANEIRF